MSRGDQPIHLVVAKENLCVLCASVSNYIPIRIVVERGYFNALVGDGNQAVQVVISVVRHLEVGKYSLGEISRIIER